MTGGPAGGLALGDLQVTPIPIDTRTARMDLAFSLAERRTDAGEPAGIDGTVEFRTDVFDEAQHRALVDRFQRYVAAMTADRHSGCRRWTCSTPLNTPASIGRQPRDVQPARTARRVDSCAVRRPRCRAPRRGRDPFRGVLVELSGTR